MKIDIMINEFMKAFLQFDLSMFYLNSKNMADMFRNMYDIKIRLIKNTSRNVPYT